MADFLAPADMSFAPKSSVKFFPWHGTTRNKVISVTKGFAGVTEIWKWAFEVTAPAMTNDGKTIVAGSLWEWTDYVGTPEDPTCEKPETHRIALEGRDGKQAHRLVGGLLEAIDMDLHKAERPKLFPLAVGREVLCIGSEAKFKDRFWKTWVNGWHKVDDRALSAIALPPPPVENQNGNFPGAAPIPINAPVTAMPAEMPAELPRDVPV